MVGHTLVELLIALAVTLSVFGAAVAVIVPASEGFTTIPEHGDQQQRLRSAVDALRGDLAQASGGNVMTGPDAWPRVTPCGWGRDPVSGAHGPCVRDDVLTVSVAERDLWVNVRGPAGGDVLTVERPAGCPSGETGCGFAPGDAVIMSDGYGRAAPLVVDEVPTDDSLRIASLGTYGPDTAGAVLASGLARTYYVRHDPATGALQLRRREGLSDQPVVDHVTHFTVEYFGWAAPPSFDAEQAWPTYGPAPVRDASPAGAWVDSCAWAVESGRAVSRLRSLPVGSDGLAVLPPSVFLDGPWCPDGVSPWRVDLDVFRISRTRLTLGLQSASATSRGPRGAWFSLAGSGRQAGRLVPDFVISFDVALRGCGR